MNNNSLLKISRKIKSWCVDRPRHLFCLPFNRHYYCGPTYYPEQKRKRIIRVFFDQVEQIWKYGEPENFYFMYGLDSF